MDRYKVRRYAGSRADIAGAMESCKAELKERLWRDVWKDEIELTGVVFILKEGEDGVIEVTAEI